MKTIILAGGLGTRLKDVIDDVPKPMAPIGGRPFLEYMIDMLAAEGLTDIILSVGYRKEIITAHFRDGSERGVAIAYCEEDAPLGTGGAIRQALLMADEPQSLVLNGDTFNSLDYRRLVEFHDAAKALMTIALRYEDDGGRYGSVTIGPSGEIISYREKASRDGGYINRGVYVISRELLPLMPEGRFSLEDDLFPKLVGSGLFGYVSDGFFVDIGIPATYHYIDAHADLLGSGTEH